MSINDLLPILYSCDYFKETQLLSPAVTLKGVQSGSLQIVACVKSMWANASFQYSALFNTYSPGQLLSRAQCADGIHYLAPRQQLVWVISGITSQNLVTSGLERNPYLNSDAHGQFPCKCFLLNKLRTTQLQRSLYLVLQSNSCVIMEIRSISGSKSMVSIHKVLFFYVGKCIMMLNQGVQTHTAHNVCEHFK